MSPAALALRSDVVRRAARVWNVAMRPGAPRFLPWCR